MIYERRINYYETDAMQIVHHSNYIRFLEEARCRHLDQMGVPYKVFEENGLLIPVMSAELKFKSPAKYDDIIVIDMNITEFTGVRMTVEYKVTLKGTDKIVLEAKTGHCFTDGKLKPISLKKANKEIYDKIYNEFKRN